MTDHCPKCGTVTVSVVHDTTIITPCNCPYKPPADLQVYDETSRIDLSTLRVKDVLHHKGQVFIWAEGKSEGQ